MLLESLPKCGHWLLKFEKIRIGEMTSDTVASRGVAGASKRAVFDAFRTFQQVPKDVAGHSVDEAHRLQILNCSENFREQLRALAADIGTIAERDEESDVSLDSDYDTIYSIEKSWQICEIFSVNPTKLLSIELIKWLKVMCLCFLVCLLQHA